MTALPSSGHTNTPHASPDLAATQSRAHSSPRLTLTGGGVPTDQGSVFPQQRGWEARREGEQTLPEPQAGSQALAAGKG